MIQMGFLKVRGSDYTRERWEQIKALRIIPRMFHNRGTLRYSHAPKRMHETNTPTVK